MIKDAMKVVVMFFIMMIIALLIWCSLAEGQVIVDDFSAGLYSHTNIFQIPSNGAQKCDNWNLSDGTLHKRRGYTAMSDTLLGKRPLYGLYGYIGTACEKKTLGVFSYPLDSTMRGLGWLLVSEAFSYGVCPDTTDTNYDTLIYRDPGETEDTTFDTTYTTAGDVVYDHIYTGETPFWATWQNDVFFSNGRQAPIIVRDSLARDLVPHAPGGIRVYPMNQGSGPLGEYYYLARVVGKLANNNKYGYGPVIGPIYLNDEKALITNLPYRTVDTHWTDTTGTDWDSTTVVIFRTKANVGKLGDSVYFHQIYYDTIPISILDTFKIIDSIPDDSLGYGSYPAAKINLTSKRGRTSAGAIENRGFRTGSPTYVAANEGGDGDDYIFPDSLADSTDTKSVSYIMTYIDTLTGHESDSGRSAFFYRKTADSNYTLGLLLPPKGMGHLHRAIYKSYNIYVYNDTGLAISDTPMAVVDSSMAVLHKWQMNESDVEAALRRYYELIKDGRAISGETEKSSDFAEIAKLRLLTLTPLFAEDSIQTYYRRIAIIKDSTTDYFVDTVSFDSTRLGKIFSPMALPIDANYVTAAHDRLWMGAGSELYWSRLDTSGMWDIVRMLSLNEDDGDEITGIVATEGYIKAYKNNSQYAAYPTGGIGEYARGDVVNGIGCVAPHSLVQYMGDVFYLSGCGVIHEKANPHRPGSVFDTISRPIDNLLDYTPAELRTAVGFVHDNKYRLSFPAKDTTYVYDLTTHGWSVWTYSFSQACLYDTVHATSINRAKDMLFIQDDDDRIMKADTTGKDKGGEFLGVYESPPILGELGHQVSFDRLGVWLWTYDTLFLNIQINESDGDSVYAANKAYYYADIWRYRNFALPSDASDYLTIEISDRPESGGIYADSLAIDRLEIHTVDKGATLIE